MLKEFLKDYFSFTKKERTAVIILIVLVTIVFLLPHMIPDNDPVVDEASLQTFSLQLAKLQTVNADTAGYDFNDENTYTGSSPSADNAGTGTVFYFDPNTLSFAGWQKLGIGERTIKTIQNYLSKGGRFRRREDIGKIYGIRSNDVQRLLPYVQIKSETSVLTSKRNSYTSKIDLPQNRRPPEAVRVTASSMLDINIADTSALIALPGIGSKLALRIIHFREKLGGFYSLDQLSEVYGLADSILRRITPGLTISFGNIETININTASANELKQHPYFRQNLGNAIVAYRLQHGMYTSKEDLLKIDIITPEVVSKIAPYVSLN